MYVSDRFFAVFRKVCPPWLVPWGLFMSTSEAHQCHSGGSSHPEWLTYCFGLIHVAEETASVGQPQRNSQSITKPWRECSLLIISTRGSNYQRAKKELPHWESATYRLNVRIPQIHVLRPNEKVWGGRAFGGWLGHKAEPSRMGLVPLIKETPEGTTDSFTM